VFEVLQCVPRALSRVSVHIFHAAWRMTLVILSFMVSSYLTLRLLLLFSWQGLDILVPHVLSWAVGATTAWFTAYLVCFHEFGGSRKAL
jgi:hypothetical protein